MVQCVFPPFTLHSVERNANTAPPSQVQAEWLPYLYMGWKHGALCTEILGVCVCVELHCRSVLCKMRIEDCCSAIKVINTHKLCHLHQNTHSYTFMCKASQRMNLPVIIYLHLFCGGGTQSNSCRPQTVCEVYLEMVNSLINGSDTSYQVLSCGTVCVPNFWVACG